MQIRLHRSKRCFIPLFLFHLCDGNTTSSDDMGVEFVSLELAYLDAFRAASEIWLDMANRGLDASNHAFEITDGAGTLLIELPFSEIFRRTGRRAVAGIPIRRLVGAAVTTARSRELAEEIVDLVIATRKTLEDTQRVLQRSRFRAL